MNPYGYMALQIVLMLAAFAVATIKSRDGLLDWFKWFGGVWVAGNIAVGVLKLTAFLVRLSGGGS